MFDRDADEDLLAEGATRGRYGDEMGEEEDEDDDGATDAIGASEAEDENEEEEEEEEEVEEGEDGEEELRDGAGAGAGAGSKPVRPAAVFAAAAAAGSARSSGSITSSRSPTAGSAGGNLASAAAAEGDEATGVALLDDVLPLPGDDTATLKAKRARRDAKRGVSEAARFAFPSREPQEERQRLWLSYLRRLEGDMLEADPMAPGAPQGIGHILNHSCDPNCIIVPVFIEVQDARAPLMAFFTSRDVMPGEELCWDYGQGYVDAFLDGGRGCECDVCVRARKSKA
jgi:hypothetical protein